MALFKNHGIAENKQVLLAHDGRLLEHQQMIGATAKDGRCGSFLYNMLTSTQTMSIMC